MNMNSFSESTEILDEGQQYLGFSNTVDTLVVDDVEVRFDFQLGDEDLEVSLLVESLEQQYRDHLDATTSQFLNVQSVKEWISHYRHDMAGLFRYLKQLTSEA